MDNEKTATIGVIGGSGLYELFEPGTADEIDVPTPFGATSSPISVGTMSGRRVAFLTRHGRAHSVAPHRIEHRANLWALRSLGVRAVVSSSAVGGLHPDYAPGTFVVTDQLIDRTWGRADTYFEDEVQHLSFADPFDPVLRRAAIDAIAALDVPFRPTGTCVVIQGPRFSSRAESVWMREAGGHTINMTMSPEVPLAAEARHRHGQPVVRHRRRRGPGPGHGRDHQHQHRHRQHREHRQHRRPGHPPGRDGPPGPRERGDRPRDRLDRGRDPRRLRPA